MPENTWLHEILLKYPFLINNVEIAFFLSVGASQDKDMSSVLFLLETGFFNYSSDSLPFDPIEKFKQNVLELDIRVHLVLDHLHIEM